MKSVTEKKIKVMKQALDICDFAIKKLTTKLDLSKTTNFNAGVNRVRDDDPGKEKLRKNLEQLQEKIIQGDMSLIAVFNQLNSVVFEHDYKDIYADALFVTAMGAPLVGQEPLVHLHESVDSYIKEMEKYNKNIQGLRGSLLDVNEVEETYKVAAGRELFKLCEALLVVDPKKLSESMKKATEKLIEAQRSDPKSYYKDPRKFVKFFDKFNSDINSQELMNYINNFNKDELLSVLESKENFQVSINSYAVSINSYADKISQNIAMVKMCRNMMRGPIDNKEVPVKFFKSKYFNSNLRHSTRIYITEHFTQKGRAALNREDQFKAVKNSNGKLKNLKKYPWYSLIKNIIRFFLVRKIEKKVREYNSVMLENKNKNKNATKIQSLTRGIIARKKVREIRQKEPAAIKIQSLVRGKMVRGETQKMRNAATKIQAIFRGEKARRILDKGIPIAYAVPVSNEMIQQVENAMHGGVIPIVNAQSLENFTVQPISIFHDPMNLDAIQPKSNLQAVIVDLVDGDKGHKEPSVKDLINRYERMGGGIRTKVLEKIKNNRLEGNSPVKESKGFLKNSPIQESKGLIKGR